MPPMPPMPSELGLPSHVASAADAEGASLASSPPLLSALDAPGASLGSSGLSAPVGSSEPSAPTEVAATVAAPVRRRRSLVVGVAAAALLAGALAIPVPQQVSIPATLTAVELAVPQVPRAGVIASVDVVDGATVTKGQVIAHLRTDELEKARDALATEVAALQQQLDAQASVTPSKMQVFARALLARKQKELAAMTARRDGALAAAAADVKKRKTVELLFGKPLALKTKEVADAEALLARETPADDKAQWSAQLAAIEAKRGPLADAIAASVITAPEAGVFVAPAMHRVDGEVAERQAYGRLNRPDAYALAYAVGSLPPSARLGTATLVLSGGARLSGLLADGAPPGVLVQLPPGQAPAGAVLEVPGGSVPAARWLLQRVRGPAAP